MIFRKASQLSVLLGWVAASPLAAQEPVTDKPPVADEVAQAQDAEESDFEENEFADLDIEALFDVSVTSVAGVGEPLGQTPAAMFVITAEDIRRSGHRSIPELLRTVPGMAVAQIDANQWAITARGFNDKFANKLLVLIDGRTVYTPLFSGVYWDVQDTVLEDIERIEVIRGPGATLWGANAVNGVINIVTKHAKDTQGLLLSGGGGTEERGFGTLRYGMKLSEDAYLRFYGKYFNRDRFVDPDGHDQPDDWDMYRGGFRLDWQMPSSYSLTLQGDIYGTDRIGEDQLETRPAPIFSKHSRDDRRVGGGNVLMRLSRDISEQNGWSCLVYYDRTDRATKIFEENRDTFDVDFRHHFATMDPHEFIWGLGWRHTRDRIEDTFSLEFHPHGRSDNTFSAFFQDTIELVENRLALMIGTKLEHNDYTGFEFQPNVRVAWTPDDTQTLWASVARVVRTPSRSNDDIDLTLAVLPFPAGQRLRLVGNRDFESEEMLAYELGYRLRPTDNLLVEVAAFFNDYENLSTNIAGLADPFTLVMGNEQAGESYGVEVAATWDVTDKWRLNGSYSWFKLNLHGGDETRERSYPQHQIQVGSHLDVSDDVELNTRLYYVDNLSALGVPSYVRLDAGLTWRPKPGVEVSVWGQNLLDDRHLEYLDLQGSAHPTEIQQGVYAAIKVEF